MADYSLVPVEHQPDFENVTLVPVEHDPFSADDVTLRAQSPQAQTQHPTMGAGQSSAPTHGGATTDSTGSALTAGTGDFFRSIPRGVVSGFNSAASALGRATQAEMGQDVDAPTPEQGMQILEKEVTGPMYRPEGRAGQFGASVGEFLGNPASYMAAGGMPLKVGAAVLGGLGSEAGGQLGEGTPWEGPLRFAGGVLGPLGAVRLGTGARAAEQASAGLGPAAEYAPRTFYRGDQAGLTEFQSHAAKVGGQAYSEAVLAKGNKNDLMAKHTFDSSDPPSPYISVTPDPGVARRFALRSNGTVYQLQLAPGRAIPNPFNLLEESEYLVPHYISPDEIKGTLP
ncbi:MAG: hypothetical protein EKK33_21340 [Bradyrhizobiaceae bacterium]|jgi:hypothetical protein|nr:MAG: hypothetical protein EKK33_21340 [Bradyrhizobiaceae bacterium]